MNTFQRSAAAVNTVVMAVMKLPVLERLLGRSMGILTYTGRKSGRKITLPLAIRHRGDHLKIAVAMPDKKTWWRNFSTEGGRVDVELGGVHYTGVATSTRDDRGRVFVDVALDR